MSYTSSNTAVATVSSAGVIKAIKPGSAKIAVRAKSGKAKATVHVSIAYKDDGANYYFYGIGNANYKTAAKLPGCVNDVQKIAAAFQRASFCGRPFSTVDYQTDLSGLGISSYLARIATNPAITEKDTTVFYYSGHGATTERAGDEFNGALCGIDGTYVTVNDVRKFLDQVPGRVVVILDSCLSGQFIESKAAGDVERQAQAFEKDVLSAFSKSSASNFAREKSLIDSENPGKYKILTACRPLESSYAFGSGSQQYGIFSRYVVAAMGTKRPADTNKDKRITLRELNKYVAAKVKSLVAAYNRQAPRSKRITQHVMVWPPSDKSFVFAVD